MPSNQGTKGGNQGGQGGSSGQGFAGMDDQKQRDTARQGGQSSAQEQDRDAQGQFTGRSGSSNQGQSGGSSGKQGGSQSGGSQTGQGSGQTQRRQGSSGTQSGSPSSSGGQGGLRPTAVKARVPGRASRPLMGGRCQRRRRHTVRLKKSSPSCGGRPSIATVERQPPVRQRPGARRPTDRPGSAVGGKCATRARRGLVQPVGCGAQSTAAGRGLLRG